MLGCMQQPGTHSLWGRLNRPAHWSGRLSTTLTFWQRPFWTVRFWPDSFLEKPCGSSC